MAPNFCSDDVISSVISTKMANGFQLSGVVASSRASKTRRLRTHEGADVVYCTAKGGLCAPFGPGTFDKNTPATRMNLDVRLDDADALAVFDELDSWAVQYIADNAERIFKRTMTREQVTSGYHPCVRRKDGYDLLLHAKISTDGLSAIHCWDTDGAAREMPSEWRRTRLQLRFHVTGLWIMGSGFGLVVSATDVQVVSELLDSAAVRVCPF